MKTLIVDDHKLISAYLNSYIQKHFPHFTIDVVENLAPNPVEKISSFQPELVILDISLNNEESIDFFIPLKAKMPNTFFIIYTMHNLDLYKSFFYKNGANAFMLKENAELEMKEVIESVLRGERVFPGISGQIDDADYRLNQLTFSSCEKTMLKLLIDKKNTSEMSKAANITEIEVLNMRRHLLDKCQAKNTQELICFALKYKWYL